MGIGSGLIRLIIREEIERLEGQEWWETVVGEITEDLEQMDLIPRAGSIDREDLFGGWTHPTGAWFEVMVWKFPSTVWDDVIDASRKSLGRIAGRTGWRIVKVTTSGYQFDPPSPVLNFKLEPVSGESEGLSADQLGRPLYHITDQDSVASILRGGLEPRTRQLAPNEPNAWSYSPRIYIMKGKRSVRDLLESGTFLKDKVPVVLSISTARIPKGMVFHRDAEAGNEEQFYWTDSSIPAGAISIVPDQEQFWRIPDMWLRIRDRLR